MAKQNIRVELYYSGAWHDVTSAVYVRDGITITRGRSDESSVPSPTSASLTFDNRAGTYNPENPASVLYGLVGRNTPIRITDLDIDGHVLASDTFTRSVVDGWGTSTSGHAWSFSNGTNAERDVNGTAGTVAVTSSFNTNRDQYLSGVTAADVEIVCSFKVSRLASAGFVNIPGVVLCRQSSTKHVQAGFYLGNTNPLVVLLGQDGNTVTSIDTGYTYAANTKFWIRARKIGQQVQVRAWPDSVSEPSVWHIDEAVGSSALAGSVGTFTLSNDTVATTYTFDDFTVTDPSSGIRFHGEVSSWAPQRAVDDGDAWTQVTAAGVTRRLGQGADPLNSALRRAVPNLGGTAYAWWPLEDAERSTRADSGLVKGRPMTISKLQSGAGGAVTWKDNRGPVGAAGCLSVLDAPGMVLSGPVDMPTTVTSWGVSWWWMGPSQENPADLDVPDVAWQVQYPADAVGVHRWWHIFINTGGEVVLNTGVDIPSEVFRTSFPASASTIIDTPRLVTITVKPFGADVLVDLYIDGVNEATYTLATTTIFPIAQVLVGDVIGNGSGAAVARKGILSHIVVHGAEGNLPDLAAMYAAGIGHTGETAGERVVRLCGEENLTSVVVGDETVAEPMGPQLTDPLLSVLAEAGETDLGVVTDARPVIGVLARTRVSLYNQTAKLALDFAADQVAPPLDPVIDDQAVRNDVTVTRRDGGTRSDVLETGSLSVQAAPNGVGRYATQQPANVAVDGQLIDQSGWRLHLGTIGGTRYPQVTADLDATPALAYTACAVDVGDRITIDNLPDSISPDPASLIVQGYTETIGSHRRMLTYNCTPEPPWVVAAYAAGTEGPAEPVRYSPVSSATAASFVSGTSTSLTVEDLWSPDKDLWSTSAATPFDVKVAGVRLRVTAVSALSSGVQTLTVQATPINGVAKSIPVGSRVELWQPAVYAL
jgi:hypothetical protein